MIEFIRRHKIATAVVVFDVIAILAVVFFIVLHNAKNATVDIYVAPSGATIELNGKKYDNFSSYELMPGNYRVRISMEGMKTNEYDFTLEPNGFVRVWKYLLDDNGSLEYYLNNPNEITFLSRFTDDKIIGDFMNHYDKVSSIRDVLPLEYYERIDPNNTLGVFVEEDTEDCTKELLCLVVYGGEQNRNIALDLIKQAGYNPDDYRIRFEEE
jgi:hypothetical protein